MTPARAARQKIKQSLQIDCETMTAVEIAEKYGWENEYTRRKLSSLGLSAKRARKQVRTGAYGEPKDARARRGSA